MLILIGFFIIWIFNSETLGLDNESLSFVSPTKFSKSDASYWQHNLSFNESNSILQRGLRLNLYVNQPQGLLLYLIDDKFRTLWLELDYIEDVKSSSKSVNVVLKVSYYHFSLNKIIKSVISLTELCSSDVKINLKIKINLLLVNNSNLLISCNNNNSKKKVIYYSPDYKFNRNEDADNFDVFTTTMSYPIPLEFPKFPASLFTTITRIWLGNIPTYVRHSNQSRSVTQSLATNYHGCIINMFVNNNTIPLATEGSRVGPLIQPRCNPVCTETSCHNNGRCIELWQSNFHCECKPSLFIGPLCSQDYCRKFAPNTNITKIDLNIDIDQFQLAFKLNTSFGYFNGFKLLSFQFVLDKFLYLYIDLYNILHATVNILQLDGTSITSVAFKLKLNTDNFYIVYGRVVNDGIELELAYSKYQFVAEKIVLKFDPSYLIVKEMLVGDSHSASMKWTSNFVGYITNVKLTNRKTSYIWNQSELYKKLPPCSPVPIKVTGEPEIDQITIDGLVTPNPVKSIPTYNIITFLSSGRGLIFIFLMISILFIVIIGFVLIYVNVRSNSLKYVNKPQPYKGGSGANNLLSIDNKRLETSNGHDDYHSMYHQNPSLYYSTNVNNNNNNNGYCSTYNTLNPSLNRSETNTIPYKPAYKARSLSSAGNSTDNMSQSTTPRVPSKSGNTHPYLALPEDSWDL